jgi:hypothetical protein
VIAFPNAIEHVMVADGDLEIALREGHGTYRNWIDAQRIDDYDDPGLEAFIVELKQVCSRYREQLDPRLSHRARCAS